MLQELDTVVLLKNIDKYALVKGDTGTIVHRYQNGQAFEVEFVQADGSTIGLLTLTVDDIRPMHRGEILHARELTAA
jgi:ATP-dependent exoDNAse (exonuclease V) alpha subunit